MTQPSTVRRAIANKRRLRELQAQLDDQTAKAETAPHAWVKPAAVSSAITLLVALIAAGVAWATTQTNSEEAREQESRERKSQIYADYLASARQWNSARYDAAAASWPPAGALGSTPDAKAKQANDANFYKKAAEFDAAQAALKKQIDLIYVYGSDAAWSTHLTWAEAANFDDKGKGLPDALATETALAEFQKVFCQEASPTPRKGCNF